jgi:VWFA-related protein
MTTPYVARMCLALLWLPLLEGQGVEAPVATKVNSDVGSRIRLNVVVNDKSGKPVSDLQQQDFQILDNKSPQPILSFEAVAGTHATTDPLEVILIIDAVNIPYTRVAYARDQLKRFLRQDNGVLAWPLIIGFLSDSGLELQGAPSRDGNALATFLDQNQSALRIINRSQGFWGKEDQMQLSVKAFEQLGQYAGRIPGRKIVICLSPGWPMLSGPNMELTKNEEEVIFNNIVALSTELRESGITLYDVDPLGTTDSGSFRTFYWESFIKGVRSAKDAQIGNLALQVLAFQSGGRVLNSNNDVTAEIETCVRDANTYYILSFAPEPADGPNDYHTIQVKIDRPKLKAQTLDGYYAQPPLKAQ